MANTPILVTGGAGFIGSNFINYALGKNRRLNILNLDKLTYAGNLLNLSSVENNKRYKFVRGDISSRKFVNDLFDRHRFTTVVNFAAESHVDRSIMNPDRFLKTNIIGTQVLLDAARKYGTEKFIQISTDEVYGSVVKGRSREDDTLMPNSPYSASKASADLLCRSYSKTFGVPVIITRSSNNYGPFQFPEKLIPLMVNNAIEGKELPIYAEGRNIRDWIFVTDNCEAIYEVMLNGKIGEVYNIGGGNTEQNINIVKMLCEIVGLKTQRPVGDILSLITYVKDRPAHDFRYSLDISKISNELGWKPRTLINEGLEKTVEWYISNQQWIRTVQNNSYRKYYKKNYLNRLQ